MKINTYYNGDARISFGYDENINAHSVFTQTTNNSWVPTMDKC